MGANVEFMEDRDGWLGIHYAARWGDMSMLKSYIKAGANIDGKTNSKETALHKCGRWDRKEAAIYLLSLGANPAFKNGDGNKASDMTADPEMKFLLDNFEEYQYIQREKKEKERQEREKEMRSPTGSPMSPRHKKLYGVQGGGLSISIEDIMKSTIKSKQSPNSPRSIVH